MPKIVAFDPWELEMARDLEKVIQGHQERVSRFKADLQAPVLLKEDEELLVRTLTSLLFETIQRGHGRKWALTEAWCFGTGGSVAIEEARTETRARFLIFQSSYGLVLHLDRARFFDQARDSFWADILSLRNLGRLDFEPMAIPEALSGRQGEVPMRADCAVGELMRYWHCLQLEDDSLMDFGSLQVSWPLATPVKALVPAMSETLETFYRISYELFHLERQTLKDGGLR